MQNLKYSKWVGVSNRHSAEIKQIIIIIIIRYNEKGICMLIDVEISGDRNVIKKETEKIIKYKNLTIEI